MLETYGHCWHTLGLFIFSLKNAIKERECCVARSWVLVRSRTGREGLVRESKTGVRCGEAGRVEEMG